MCRPNRSPHRPKRHTNLGTLVALGLSSLAFSVAAACGDAAPVDVGDGAGGALDDGTGGDRTAGSTSSSAGGALTMGGDDVCPGSRVVLHLGSELTIEGDTGLATDDYGSSCGVADTGGPDVVFDLAVAGTGTLTARLTPREDGYDPTLIVISATGDPAQCDGQEGTLLCLSLWEQQESFAYEVGPDAAPPFDRERFTLIVDGEGAGEYRLDLSFVPPACGDGADSASTGEECDDGNTAPADGCSATCTIEPELVGDVCGDPAMTLVTVEPDGPELVNGATWGYGDDYAPVVGLAGQGCASEPLGGNDRVVPFMPTESGWMTVSVGLADDGFSEACEVDGLTTPLCWDAVLYVTGPNVCDADADGILDAEQLACADEATLGMEMATFAVTKGQEYYAIVEPAFGTPTADGAFNLRFDLDVTP